MSDQQSTLDDLLSPAGVFGVLDVQIAQITTGLNLLRNRIDALDIDGPLTVRDQNELAFLQDALDYFAKDAERQLTDIWNACRATQGLGPLQE